jgi:hypothetical protein
MSCYVVEPLYGARPEIIFDKKNELFKKTFGKNMAFVMRV